MMRKVLLLLVLAPGLGCGELAGIEEKEFVEPRPVLLSALNCTTCARRPDGSLWCWGDGADGQLGSMAAQQSNDGRPMRIELPERVRDVSVGTLHVCAVLDSGKVFCWGGNKGGQTGAPASTSSPPEEVKGVDDVTSVSAGFFHTCALTRAGKVWCWGLNHAGQCGVQPQHEYSDQPDKSQKCQFERSKIEANAAALILSPTEVDLPAPAEELMVQKNTTCALLEGKVLCWGSNCGAGEFDDSYFGNDCSKGGQLGVDPATLCFRWKPESVFQTKAYLTTIGMAHISGFAADVEGKLFSWGWGMEQLGQGVSAQAFKSAERVVFEGIADGLPVDKVYRTNGWHQLARYGGDHYSWGENTCGELGYGNSKPAKEEPYPSAWLATEVPSGVDSLSSGQDHTCFAVGDHVSCLGNERYTGQDADGKTPPKCGGENYGICPTPALEPRPVLFE